MEYLLQIRDTDSEKIVTATAKVMRSHLANSWAGKQKGHGWSQVPYSGSCLNMDDGSQGRC